MRLFALGLFSHPDFLRFHSMPRFTRMLTDGMKQREHKIEIWKPKPLFFLLPFPNKMKKWLGYLDQFIIFPVQVLLKLKKCKCLACCVHGSLFRSLIPLIKNRSHVIHCHDFLAQRSALGEIEDHETSWSGKKYQSFIRRGFFKGECFISVSQKYREDLHRLLPSVPRFSEVVYNGLTQTFLPHNLFKARSILQTKIDLRLSNGYILHVGGNQWYKNRVGAIEIYNALRSISSKSLPFVLIGPKPGGKILDFVSESSCKDDIHFISGLEDEFV